jgi:hypothetical protein
MKSRAKRQTSAAERPPIPTIAGSIRMGSSALLEPGTGIGKRDGAEFGHLRELLTDRSQLDIAEKLGFFGLLCYNVQFGLHCC